MAAIPTYSNDESCCEGKRASGYFDLVSAPVPGDMKALAHRVHTLRDLAYGAIYHTLSSCIKRIWRLLTIGCYALPVFRGGPEMVGTFIRIPTPHRRLRIGAANKAQHENKRN
jgi:hypothetical protein